ncbi:MAG: hypothetical protein O6914_06760 [Chloroflexi bacterium]|nr:hypothetical protein [Chloroflexota bacterium]
MTLRETVTEATRVARGIIRVQARPPKPHQDAEPEGHDDGAALAPISPVGGVTLGPEADGLTGSPLRQERASAVQLAKAEGEGRIRVVARQRGIGGHRKIADAKLADHGMKVCHMTVQRVLKTTHL